MKKIREYALYKGDEFLTIGTKQELADYMNVSTRTVTFYESPTNLKRYENRKKKGYVVIKLEEETEDEYTDENN